MRYLRGLAAAAALTIAVAVPAAAATTVSVRGDAGWVSTGVGVTAGQVIQIKAVGFVQTAPVSTFNNPGVSIPASGPAGQTVVSGAAIPKPRSRAMSSRRSGTARSGPRTSASSSAASATGRS
jgi:hypothetical protein